MKASEKNMGNGKLAGKIAILVAMTIVLVAPAGAQTWQSLGKSAVIPVVVENTACNPSTDTVGITADRKVLLSCQSSVWKRTTATATADLTRAWLDGLGLPYSKVPAAVACYSGTRMFIMQLVDIQPDIDLYHYMWINGNNWVQYRISTGAYNNNTYGTCPALLSNDARLIQF